MRLKSDKTFAWIKINLWHKMRRLKNFTSDLLDELFHMAEKHFFEKKSNCIKNYFSTPHHEIQLTLKSETSRTSSCCVLLFIPVLLESSFLKKWWCSTVIRQILFAIPAVGQTKPILASVFRTEPARTFTKKKSRL